MTPRRETLADDYDARANSLGCYELAIRFAREQFIRRRQIVPEPGNAREARWAAEGDRPTNQLDTVRHIGLTDPP